MKNRDKRKGLERQENRKLKRNRKIDEKKPFTSNILMLLSWTKAKKQDKKEQQKNNEGHKKKQKNKEGQKK